MLNQKWSLRVYQLANLSIYFELSIYLLNYFVNYGLFF